MNRGLIVIIAVIAIGVALIGYRMGSGGGDTALAPVELGELTDEELLALATPVMLGDPEAGISIIEFGDYQCAHCGTFNAQVKPQVDLNYVQTGQANFVFYDFPLGQHPHAFIAARAARCAGDQDAYWGYHDKLFAAQQLWSPSASAPLGLFESYAAELGLNESDFSSCLRSDRYADVVTANGALGQNLGVSSTPTVMISDGSGQARRPVTNQFDEIRGMVDALLAARTGGMESSNEGGQ